MRLDDKHDVILKTKDGREEHFQTLREALLFSWDYGCERIESIHADSTLIVLQQSIWRD